MTAFAAGLCVVLVGGCAGKMGSVPNPFSTADKVPPPATRVIAPGTAAPYYPNDPLPQLTVNPPVVGAPLAGAPAAGSPFGAAPPFTGGQVSAAPVSAGQPWGGPAPSPLGAAPAAAGQPITPYPGAPPGSGGVAPSLPATTPYGAAPAPYSAPYGAPPSTYTAPTNSPYSAVQAPPSQPMAARTPATIAPGDAIRAPSDSGPLRFEPQGPWAGPAATPRSPAAAPQFAAAPPPRASQLPATANGWVSGSAPVRAQVASSDPLRVRVPNGGIELREPVSVAALGGAPSTNRVQITPLDSLPNSAPAGDGRSPETLGWR